MARLRDAEIEAGTALAVSGLGMKLPKGRGASRLWSDGHWVFRGVEFSLKRGETFAVLGRNGSGKSTLLRTLAGILAPSEGEIRVAPGLTSSILAPSVGFDRELTGRENIFISAMYQGIMRDQIEPKMEQIVAFSEIGSWIDQPVAIYSAGMRARLGFSLSLYLPSDILMIDETLSAGDATFRDKATAAVHELIASDRTVVLISHNPQTIKTMCTRGLVLDNGRMVTIGEIGQVQEVYDEIVSAMRSARRQRIGNSKPVEKAGIEGQTTVVSGAPGVSGVSIEELQFERDWALAERHIAREKFHKTRQRLEASIEKVALPAGEADGNIHSIEAQLQGAHDAGAILEMGKTYREYQAAKAELDDIIILEEAIKERIRLVKVAQ